MLDKTKDKKNINALNKEIIVSLNLKLQEGRELFYNTSRVKLNQGQELIIREKIKGRISHL